MGARQVIEKKFDNMSWSSVALATIVEDEPRIRREN
jgi:hypothetical protein